MICEKLLSDSAPHTVVVIYSIKAHVVFVDFDKIIGCRGVSFNDFLYINTGQKLITEQNTSIKITYFSVSKTV